MLVVGDRLRSRRGSRLKKARVNLPSRERLKSAVIDSAHKGLLEIENKSKEVDGDKSK